jgi:hypothetical protein
MREIESGEVGQMRDSSSIELLNEIDKKTKRARYGPLSIWVGGGIALFTLGLSDQAWVFLLTVTLTLCVVRFAYYLDRLRKTVVLLYDLEPEVERVYQSLHDAFDSLVGCASSWHVEAEGDVEDWKRNAGATSVVRRQPIRLSKKSPPFVTTNIETPMVPVGRQTLYFFPDRILVFERNAVGAASYRDLMIERSTGRFIEDGVLPQDATVVDRTWKYVNKKGGPDKRFRDNRELPIALYEYIHLTSGSGLNELIQFSRPDAGRAFEVSLQASRTTPSASAAT